MPPIQFPSGRVLDSEIINEVQEKIKRVLKEELPEDYQTGEVFEHIFLDLNKKRKTWKVEL